MNIGEIMQGLTLLAIGGIARYMFDIEHRLTRIETKLCSNPKKDNQHDD